MFARSATRAALQSRPAVRQGVRRYATEPPPPPPPRPQQQATFNSTTALFVGAIVIALGGGYVAVRGTSSNSVAQKAQTAVKEAVPALAPKKAFTGGDQGFISLKLEDVEIVNHNTKKLRFKLPEEDMVSGLHIASAILTKFKPADAEKPVIRPYTPVNDEDAPGYLDLLIKKYEGGPMSTHLHDMVPGQRLDIKGPLPKYPWEANKHEHIALVAGGTGITPMWQLVRAIFNNPADKTKVTLVFGNISEKDILLKNELADLENTYPQRFRAFYVLDNPPKEWAGNKGYITSDLLKTVLPEPKEENIKVFVCGPPGLMKAVSGAKKSPADQGELSGILSQLGYTKEQVYKF